MVSFRSLLAVAPLLAIAVAQGISFTSTPPTAEAGQSYNITWTGGDNSAVTLTLRRGDPQNLNTVSTIADGITANYYVWTVPTTLQSADDYALQITQGQSGINYSGLFSIQGGSGNSSSTTTTGSMSITSMGSASGTSTVMYQNTTFSSASLTSSGSSFGQTTSRSSSSRTAAATTQATSAPSNDAPIRTGSSAALILGIVAAVMLH